MMAPLLMAVLDGGYDTGLSIRAPAPALVETHEIEMKNIHKSMGCWLQELE